MANERRPDEKPTGALDGLVSNARSASTKGLPPVHLWHPAHCGDIDIVIRRDGVWMHEGSPIGRTELVRLFSTILRKDPDGYHLVTPGEKMRIEVEDLPFRATTVERRGATLVFTTDVGDEVAADLDHPIMVETNAVTGEPQPAVRVPQAAMPQQVPRAATRLPVLIDGDTGYGDVKNVTHTIEGYEALGASAIFIEDQVAPKRCGHMAGKDVIPADDMVTKIKAAAAARRSKDLFLIARTDARAVHGLDEALRRGEKYLAAGADGIFIEAPQSLDELKRVGRAFQGVPQIANMLEGGGQTPVLPPAELMAMGFAMVAYPTSVIFRVARTIEKALADIKAGRPGASGDSVDFAGFKDITGYELWAQIEDKYAPGGKA